MAPAAHQGAGGACRPGAVNTAIVRRLRSPRTRCVSPIRPAVECFDPTSRPRLRCTLSAPTTAPLSTVNCFARHFQRKPSMAHRRHRSIDRCMHGSTSPRRCCPISCRNVVDYRARRMCSRDRDLALLLCFCFRAVRGSLRIHFSRIFLNHDHHSVLSKLELEQQSLRLRIDIRRQGQNVDHDVKACSSLA